MKRPCGIEIDRFPILRFLNAADGHTIYSVPCAEYPGMMKVSCEAMNFLHTWVNFLKRKDFRTAVTFKKLRVITFEPLTSR